MSGPNSIKCEKLNRIVGTGSATILIDVRTEEDFVADPLFIPGSLRKNHQDVAQWGQALAGKSAVIICHHGAKLSEGTAAWLRQLGCDAVTLEGGFVEWQKSGLPLVPYSKIPSPNAEGQTVWVTRARPKIDRIACPWLIRRFIDRDAVFLFVAPSQVAAVAERFNATAFDIEDTYWSHRGELCTFDVMIEEFGLSTEALTRLARIVRAADTARLDLAPEAAGLLAMSLGLSRIYADDLPQLDAGMTLYDSLYRWCRDAVEETHNWPNNKAKP
jgi:rhodanese-related sulfurtransferase